MAIPRLPAIPVIRARQTTNKNAATICNHGTVKSNLNTKTPSVEAAVSASPIPTAPAIAPIKPYSIAIMLRICSALAPSVRSSTLS